MPTTAQLGSALSLGHEVPLEAPREFETTRETPGVVSREGSAVVPTSVAQPHSPVAVPRETTQTQRSVAAITESVAATGANGAGQGAVAVDAVDADRPIAPSSIASAKELFSAANHARQAGNLSAACQLYRALQGRFPHSEEALLAHLLLARLELSQRNARPALLEYERYLQTLPDGALAQEALQGKARALHQLGMRVEERRAWEELLRRFPHSAYTEAAEEHLSEGP